MSSCCIHLLRVRLSLQSAEKQTGQLVEQSHMKIGQEVVEQRHMKIGQLMAVQKAHKDRPTSGRTEADEGQYNSHTPVLLCGMDFLTVCAIL